MRRGPRGDTGLALQMYGSQEDGSIDEDALSSVLKTALGVAELTVTDLFRAIDQEEKGRITFGERPGSREGGPVVPEVRTHGTPAHLCLPGHPVSSVTQSFSRGRFFLKPGQKGGSFQI